jgi:hypothetical protein
MPAAETVRHPAGCLWALHSLVLVRADKTRPVAGECGAPIRTQGFAFAAAWRRQSMPERSEWLDGRSSAANVEVCGWGARRRRITWRDGREHDTRSGHITTRSASGSHARDRGALLGWDENFQRPMDRRITAGMKSAPHGTAGATRANISRGEFRAKRSNAGTVGSKAFADGAKAVGNDPDAKPVCGTPQAERHAAAVVALRFNGAARRKPWPGLATDDKRGPFGFSRWGRGKRGSPSPRISEGDTFSFARRQAHPRMRKAAQQPTNISPSWPEIVRGRYKRQAFSMGTSGCGVPTACADGRHRGRHNCRHHRRHETASAQAARNRLMRSSTCARGRPKRMRLISIRRRGPGRRGGGAGIRSRRIGELGTPLINSRAQAV